ncbi:MAG: thioredoxin family protein [Bacilli bacterium]|nr:thioredoxin family protein [Bacilli bacterium]
MKKALPVIAVLILLLLVSIGANVYFIVNKNSAVIKLNGEKITKDEFINDIISHTGNSYIDHLKDKVLKSDISKDEEKLVKEDVEDTMTQLEETYGDELENEIRNQTMYSSKEEYRDYLVVNKVYTKRAEDKCKDKEDEKCTGLSYYDEIISVLEKADLKIKNEELKKEWDKSIEELKDAKKYYEDYEEPVQPDVNATYDNLKELTFKELKSKINNKETFVLMITRSDCYYCLQYKPIMNQIGEEYDKIFYYIETDHISEKEYNELGKILPFSGTPTTGIFKNGALDANFEGYREKTPVINFLKEGNIIK